MALTSCRECGTPVPAGHACPRCGTRLAPVELPAAYRPPAPRPPREPERPAWKTLGGWLTAAGWLVVLAGGVFIALFIIRGSAAIDRRAATEKAEMALEEAHMNKVIAWMRDTTGTAPVPASSGRAAPTSDPARRLWVISRMMEDCSLWTREVLERHGAGARQPPAAFGTARYQANARSYPEVGRYLEGRAAAFAEIGKASPAWSEARIAALARESGMPAGEIRAIFSRGCGSEAVEGGRLADAMVEFHRQLVRMDPRVHYAGGDELRFESLDDLRRVEEMSTRLSVAVKQWNQAQETSRLRSTFALSDEID